MRTFLVILALAFSSPAWADITGKVVGVADGDTVTVLDSNKQQHKIRVAGIDAPEKAQPFGSRSKESLAKRVHNRDAVVEGHKKDRYGRLVGKVIVDGHDAGLEQVRAGLAWWYRAYAKEQTPDDRVAYELAEKAAREQKLGLWRDPDPVPPWEWRRAKREK
ncbi:MAG: thermonuclease family protein [Burkholderiales bacterium]|nr:thermonuclease family protein [Burkholderiales bacterium]